MLNDMQKTQILGENLIEKNKVKDTLSVVNKALIGKGYNPINQVVGYLLSGDPTYITSSNDARSRITSIERDELLEEIVAYYLNNNL